MVGIDQKHSATMPSALSEKAPPAYSDPVEQPGIEDLTAGFANLSIPSTTATPIVPTEPLAIAHLKLLHAFAALKEEIGFTDGVFGIWDSQASTIEPELITDVRDPANQQSQALAKIREKRWALYVARATERFAVYWTRVICRPENRRLRQEDMLGISFEQFPDLGKPIAWNTDMLPPLGKYLNHCDS